jgi:hypothetical protein
VIGYPSAQLLEEVAYLAINVHWTYDQILGLDHRERRAWVEELVRLNESRHAMETQQWR